MKTFEPCPWCGSSATMYIEPMWHGSHGYHGCYSYQVRCSKCGASAPDSKFDTIYKDTDWAENMAIEAWNKRSK